MDLFDVAIGGLSWFGCSSFGRQTWRGVRNGKQSGHSIPNKFAFPTNGHEATILKVFWAENTIFIQVCGILIKKIFSASIDDPLSASVEKKISVYVMLSLDQSINSAATLVVFVGDKSTGFK